MQLVWWLLILLNLCLPGCADSDVENYAPVSEVSAIEPLPSSGACRVRSDDTLYSIAWRYGLDYRYIARINHIARPYHIKVNQLIYLEGEHPLIKRIHVKHVDQRIIKKIKKTNKPQLTTFIEKEEIKNVEQSEEDTESPKNKDITEREPSAAVNYWQRPARGPIVETFSGMNKGINIGGQLGDPIFSTASGKVVYSGNGLRAYGNLIIIKHNSAFLSAYAHNNKTYVKEGEWVKAGQKIAEMGNTGSRRVMLHFEIRQSGKPINPLNYLAKK